MTVKAWSEKVIIPTYETGSPEKNPMFLEKRVYQGSSGVVYPHPVIEKIKDKKTDKEWNAIFLENQYLKFMVLPELGGRIQMAFDKTKQRHFVYYNQVIKPALVGLTGPWISGGIEFNWPQHHRPSTYNPVDYCIEENPDGSVTVWCSELERMFRTRGMAGFTLYTDKACLEIKVKLFNRTDYPQTFLWWANPAVKADDQYQSVFPPDVHAVFDHGKRDVSEFPIAKGKYYKVDYSPGTDISRYKNIPVPTSFMAVASRYDFIGGYDNDSKGGLLHVANHHISPGKKQWTWGNGDFGQAWDRNLTDEDGPYIELMCGVYTDNQPDFSWLMPGEEKSFSQYFMPYHDLGVVKNASKDAMVNLETEDDTAIVKVYTTVACPAAKVVLTCNGVVLMQENFDFRPAKSYEKRVPLPFGADLKQLRVEVIRSGGMPLISWEPEPDIQKPLPEPAKAARYPHEIESTEELYLTGLHLEQYRHATYDPRDYYQEALVRDPKDNRCNNSLGLWYLRRGNFDKAGNYFRQAIARLTQHNPNPINGEPYFNLGIALRFQAREEEARDAFYKSVWNAAWQDSGYFQLARISAGKFCFDEALELIDRSLIRNGHNHKALHLKTIILRKTGRIKEAEIIISNSLALDKFNFGVLFEKYLLNPSNAENLNILKKRIQGNIHTYIEFALDYAWAGQFSEAIRFISLGIDEQKDGFVYPMAMYYKAWFEKKSCNTHTATVSLQQAASVCPDYCFPNQPEAVPVLLWAANKNKNDYKAPYYLGNFWYNARNYEAAINWWEKSVAINSRFPTTRRNLALAYYNKRNNPEQALTELEKAFELDQSDARILMELDQLYKRLNKKPDKRLQFLKKHLNLVKDRDDLYLERISMYNILGNYEKAYQLIMARKFHPWEGGEGKVPGQYVISLTEMAKNAILAHEFTKATDLLEKAQFYPHNLGEGKLTGKLENEQFFWLGIAFEGLGETATAAACWEKATKGLIEPGTAMYYNDQQPDTIFYHGLSLLKLGKSKDARKLFNRLITYGKNHINDQVKIDYFAVSLPDLLIWDTDLNEQNSQLCTYLKGLGELGNGNMHEAAGLFKSIMEKDQYHTGSRIHLKLSDTLEKFL